MAVRTSPQLGVIGLVPSQTSPPPTSSPLARKTQSVVLVLNGHSPEKIPQARQWLDVLPKLPQLKTAGVVLHGNESCLDDWFWPYLASPAHRIAFVYMVYGSQVGRLEWIMYWGVSQGNLRADCWPMFYFFFKKMMDHALVRQWPLGVATYRGFPTSIPVASAVGHTVHGSYANNPHAAAPAEPPRRRFLCNLQATVGPFSSVLLTRTLTPSILIPFHVYVSKKQNHRSIQARLGRRSWPCWPRADLRRTA